MRVHGSSLLSLVLLWICLGCCGLLAQVPDVGRAVAPELVRACPSEIGPGVSRGKELVHNAGDEPSRLTSGTAAPLVHYVFCSTGDDAAYFEGLAIGYPSDIQDLIRKDIEAARATAGLSGTATIVRVRVRSADEVMDVLRYGKIPRDERSGSPIYVADELAPSAARLTGYAVLSHANSYGPLIPYPNYTKPFTYPQLQEDKRRGGAGSLYGRLVQGAHIRYAGCNSGNDYQFYEIDTPGRRGNPSIAHATAAIYSEKKVVVYGKYRSADLKSTHYVSFSCPAGLSYPVRQGKPKASYAFATAISDEAETVKIPFSSRREKEESLFWYKERGYPCRVTDETGSGDGVQGTLEVRIPSDSWLCSRETRKPALLKSVVEAVSSNPRTAWPSIQRLLSQVGIAANLLKGIQKAVVTGRLARAIHESRAAHGGKLDLDDFRLWVVLLSPEKWDTYFRADLCDDPTVAQSVFRP